LRSRR
jgi:hypothetical protein